MNFFDKMYLSHCPKDNYFKITELWLSYEEREFYNNNGLYEGDIVYVLENNEQIKALKENVQYSFTKKQASLIYGQKIVEKNKQKRIKP